MTTYSCPGSPLPVLKETDPGDNGPGNFQLVGNYVGIMGAVAGPNDASDPTGAGRTVACNYPTPVYCNFGGYLAANGVIYPGSAVRIADITDGTSNTIIVGEQSAWGNDPGVCPGGKSNSQYDLRAPVNYGLWAGSEQSVPPNPIYCGYSSGSAVTLRWPIGTKARVNYNDGMAYWGGWNKPIQSVHTGGANVLRGDGGVSFLPNSISWNVLMWLAIRDDGQVIDAF